MAAEYSNQDIVNAIRGLYQGPNRVTDDSVRKELGEVVSKLEKTLTVEDLSSKAELEVIKSQLQGMLTVQDANALAELEAVKTKLEAIETRLNEPLDTKLTGSVVVDKDIQSRTTLTAGTFKRKDIVLSDDVEYFVLSARQYNSTEPLTYDFMFSWLGYTAPGFMMELPIFHIGTRGVTTEKIDALNDRFEFRISNGSDEDIDFALSIRLFGRGDLDATASDKS